MRTKAIVRFLNRAAHFEADLELADVLSAAVSDGCLGDYSTKIFAHVDANKHPRLAARKPSQHNQKLAVSHLKGTLRAAYIKDLHEDFYSYLLEIVTAAARAGLKPGRLIGEH